MMSDEAQMILTLSMKKIVESRSRRGGASLHRNLLVAGVLFKARDVLLLTGSVAAAISSEKAASASDEADGDVERTLSCDEEETERERTVLETVSSPSSDVVSWTSDGKENVPPYNQPTSTVTTCSDDVRRSSTDKTRAAKRPSREAVDDDVRPSKSWRADTTDLVVMDTDDDDCDGPVSGEVCRQTSTLSCPAVRRSSTVSRLPCLDTRLTQHVADPALVRPLLVVQVV